VATAITSLQEYAAARTDLLERLVSGLQADERVVAAWLSGSIGRNEGDEWADFDLYVAVDDDALDSFLADRLSFYTSLGKVVHLQDEIPGHPDVGRRFHLVNFEGPIEVDFSCLPASEAQKPVGHKVLFEKRRLPAMQTPSLPQGERKAHARRWAMFFWAMAPIAVKYAGRGDTRRAIGQVDLLSRALICLWRLLADSSGPDPWQPKANRPLEEELDRRLPQAGRVLSPKRVLDLIVRLCDEAERLQESLSELDADVNQEIISETRNLAGIAANVIKERRYRNQKYR
jgi:hypothetical protein